MSEPPIFRDRVHAGQLLAEKLRKESATAQPLVLALPRGGVPVAFEIACVGVLIIFTRTLVRLTLATKHLQPG